MYKIIFALTILLPIQAFAKPLTPDEISEASCRISYQVDNEFISGSGTTVAEDMNNFYIVTNGHVTQLSRDKTVDVEFFNDGYKARPIKSRVIWMYYVKNTSLDVAIIAVNKRGLGFKPRIIPIAKYNTVLERGTRISGAGSPSGAWMQSWRARITANNTDTIAFNMAPAGGQSGTGILVDVPDEDGELITKWAGIVTWRVGSSGGGVSLNRVYQILRGEVREDKLPTKYKLVMDTKTDIPCHLCKLPRSKHIEEHGKVYCPRCKKHGLFYDTHVKNNIHGCEAQWGFGHYSKELPAREAPPNILPNSPGLSPDDELEPRGLIARLKARLAEIENKFKSLLDKIQNLVQAKENIEKKVEDYAAKLQDQLDKIEELKKKVKEDGVARTIIEQKIKDMAHPLDNVSGGNGSIVSNVLFGGSGTLLGAWLWSIFVQPFLIKRSKILPDRLLNALGEDRLHDINDGLEQKFYDKIKRVEGRLFNKDKGKSEPVVPNVPPKDGIPTDILPSDNAD